MSEQTDQNYWWLPWVLACAGVILIGLTISLIHPDRIYWNSLNPWENAYITSVYGAIQIFGSSFGSSIPTEFILKERLLILAGILVIFVIGPSLWVFSESEKGERTHGILIRGFNWYAGVMILIAGFWYAGSGILEGAGHVQMLREINHKNQMRYELSQGLLTRAVQAIQYYELPVNMGGGGQSFSMLSVPAKRSKILAIHNLETSQPASRNVFLIGRVKSGSITLFAVGKMDGQNARFKNADGEQGKMQLAVRIIPSDNRMIHRLTDKQFVN
ncbi:MAG TPA: hypothetical protein VKA08_06625 [Balneolales bacterium]|nr:hypothetical protein [Balneolales bacterium]